MSTPSGNNQRDSSDPQQPSLGLLAALTIPDQIMVFRSKDEPTNSQGSKRMASKATKARPKLREDTPTPSSKGDGWIRLDGSPFPEDKQVCKRLHFGSGSIHPGEVDEPKEENHPASPQNGEEMIPPPEELRMTLWMRSLIGKLFAMNPPSLPESCRIPVIPSPATSLPLELKETTGWSSQTQRTMGQQVQKES